MKREFTNVYQENQLNGYSVGDAAAQRAAAGLSEKADAPTIEALSDMLTLLQRVGGQFHVTAVRMTDDPENPEWETAGFAFNYETRDARLLIAQPPEEVAGVPVTDAQAPAAEVDPNPSDPSQNGTDPEACEVCGRLTPDERPDDPPCQCQVGIEEGSPLRETATAA